MACFFFWAPEPSWYLQTEKISKKMFFLKYLDLRFMKMYISTNDLLQVETTIERDMDLAFLATESVSIDASVMTVPVIKP